VERVIKWINYILDMALSYVNFQQMNPESHQVKILEFKVYSYENTMKYVNGENVWHNDRTAGIV
jgi:hypothetical protein